MKTPADSSRMLTRAITAFVTLPGTVAFAVPITLGIIGGRPVRYPALAAVLLVAGTLLLVRCVLELYIAGRGTLAPWSPPERLVTTGPYRFCRNPMYVAVLTILTGWCLLWDSHVLLWYAAGTACAFELRVLLFEEPWAARKFGEQWQAYRARVRRWAI
jgi:protein-S-isoprenylcysteine O-methyltransferase Ste14